MTMIDIESESDGENELYLSDNESNNDINELMNELSDVIATN